MHLGCYVLSVICVVQVGQGPVGRRFINPSSQVLQEHVPGLNGSYGRCEALPVTYTPLAKFMLCQAATHTLGVGVAGVKRNTIFVRDGRVEVALHLVDRLRNQTEVQLGVGEEVVQKTCK